MISKDLLDVVSDLNFWFKDQDTGIERLELEEVMRLVDMKDVAFVVLGVRRAGKTYLSKQVLKKKIDVGLNKKQTLYVNFEEKKLEPFLDEGVLDSIYDSYRYEMNKDKFAYIVFDEIQNVPGWEKWVRMVLEKKENVKLVITGSGSKIMSPKLASVLTGRKITYKLFPLQFKGFLDFKNVKLGKHYLPQKKMVSLLREYLEFGAFPLIALTEENEHKRYFLQEVYDDIVTKDILLKFRLREELLLKKTAYLVMNNFSKYVSIRKIRNLLKNLMKLNISPSTLSYYLEYFEKSFLFFFVPIYSLNIKDQMHYPKKAYCVDTGLINTVLFRFSENIGRLYENIVAIELLRKGHEIFYWKDSQEKEVDFVIKKGLKVKQLIQVCYDLKDKKVKKREITALTKAMEEFKLKKGLIITENKEGTETIKGKKIKYTPLWKWLLETKPR